MNQLCDDFLKYIIYNNKGFDELRYELLKSIVTNSKINTTNMEETNPLYRGLDNIKKLIAEIKKIKKINGDNETYYYNIVKKIVMYRTDYISIGIENVPIISIGVEDVPIHFLNTMIKKRTEWLTNEIIETYISTLIYNHPNISYINSQVWQLSEESSINKHWTKNTEIIFIPILINGNHWIGCIIDIKLYTFRVYDPMNQIGKNKPVIEKIKRIGKTLSIVLKDDREWFYINEKLIEQKDTFNCGVFVCAYFLCYVLNNKLILPFNPDKMRLDIYNNIIHFNDIKDGPNSLFSTSITNSNDIKDEPTSITNSNENEIKDNEIKDEPASITNSNENEIKDNDSRTQLSLSNYFKKENPIINFKNLQYLTMENTSIDYIPSSLIHLIELECINCSNLMIIPSECTRLTKLFIISCKKFFEIPNKCI